MAERTATFGTRPNGDLRHDKSSSGGVMLLVEQSSFYWTQLTTTSPRNLFRHAPTPVSKILQNRAGPCLTDRGTIIAC